MKKNLIVTLLISVTLIQGCTVYQKNATPLSEATNKGKVKVIHSNLSSKGSYSVHKYNNISLDDSTFYGIKGKRKESITLSESTSVYLIDPKKTKSRKILGITIPVGVIVIGVVVLVIACNCPYVDIIDESGEASFQGTLFPGAIFESLERTDQLVLDYQPKEDNVQIRISNVLPEKEYINEVKLLQYQVQPEERLAINKAGELIATSNFMTAESATDMNGDTRLKEVSELDEFAYKFNDSPKEDEFNRLDLKFNIEDQMDDLNLVIRGKQTEWVEVVGDQFFSLFGDRFNDWTQKMDKVDPEKYNQSAARTGLSLRVLAKIEGKYKLINVFHNAGTKMNRDMIVNLPPNLNYGPELELRLESAYRFWEIDHVALAKNVRSEIDFEELELTSATSNTEMDVLKQLNTIDGEYANILNTGDYINLNFKYTYPEEGIATKLILKGTGYYHHEKEYNQEINKKALRVLKKPMSTHLYSQIIEQAYTLAKNKQEQQ